MLIHKNDAITLDYHTKFIEDCFFNWNRTNKSNVASRIHVKIIQLDRCEKKMKCPSLIALLRNLTHIHIIEHQLFKINLFWCVMSEKHV